MEIFSPPNNETITPDPEKEKGCGTTVMIHFIRHADREIHQTAPETPLTEKGIQKCADFANNLTGNTIIGTYSPVERTKRTACEIIKHSPAKIKIPLKENTTLKSRASEEFIHRIQQHVAEKLAQRPRPYPDTEETAIEFCATVAGIEYYLSFGNERPRSGNTFSG